VMNAFIEGEATADSENVNRHQQRIKIKKLAVAKGMKRAGGRWLRRIPSSSRSSLPTSAVE
jgi:hypothetical protein